MLNLFPDMPDPKPAKNQPVINPDGYSIKGCSFIYAPKGQAGEYSPLAANPYRGCGHLCRYCYVPKVLQMKREEFDAGAIPRKDFLGNLEKDARKYLQAGITNQVMLSFTCDCYTPFDTSLTRPTIQILQKYGMGFCVLTKGGERALRDADLYRPDRDAFASTLTSLDEDFSLKWEPGAALPEDRIATLMNFHNQGIFTWVSLEPTLDVNSSRSIIIRTHDFVDLFKIGRANYLPMTNATDWEAYTHSMIELVDKLSINCYFKRDLQSFLPPGYPNQLRVQQHN